MPYIIDGHNLIGKLPGISLRQIDDEQRLIQRLQSWVQKKPTSIEVYFDNAPAGFAGKQSFGRVTAYYIVQGSTADNAIKRRLNQLGKRARNWTVVTSDRQVQASARSVGARVLTSESFAAIISSSATSGLSDDPGSSPEVSLDEDQLSEWLRLFNNPSDTDSTE